MTVQVQNMAEKDPQEVVDVVAEETPTEVQAVEEQPTETVQETETDTAEVKETGNREAAKYRRQLRDTEAELEATRAQLYGVRRDMLAQTLADREYKTSAGAFTLTALDDSGLVEKDIYGADGKLDLNRLKAELSQLATERPYMFTPSSTLIVPLEGRTPRTGGGEGWATAFADPDRL